MFIEDALSTNGLEISIGNPYSKKKPRVFRGKDSDKKKPTT